MNLLQTMVKIFTGLKGTRLACVRKIFERTGGTRAVSWKSERHQTLIFYNASVFKGNLSWKPTFCWYVLIFSQQFLSAVARILKISAIFTTKAIFPWDDESTPKRVFYWRIASDALNIRSRRKGSFPLKRDWLNIILKARGIPRVVILIHWRSNDRISTILFIKTAEAEFLRSDDSFRTFFWLQRWILTSQSAEL